MPFKQKFCWLNRVTCRCRLPVLKVPKWLELSSLSVARNQDIQPWWICGLEIVNPPDKRVRFVWNYLIMYWLCKKGWGDKQSKHAGYFKLFGYRNLVGQLPVIFFNLVWCFPIIMKQRESGRDSEQRAVKSYMPMDAAPNTPIIFPGYGDYFPWPRLAFRYSLKFWLDASYFGVSLHQWGDGVIFSSSNPNMSKQVFEF